MRILVTRSLLAAAALAASLTTAGAQATVYIDTVEADLRGGEQGRAVADSVRAGIRSGSLDRHGIRLTLAPGSDLSDVPADAIVREGDAVYLLVTSQTFDRLPERAQEGAVDRLLGYYEKAFLTSYRATVDPATNRLAQVPFFAHVGRNVAAVRAPVDVSKLLSSYAETWAYRSSTHHGPNCWHTSIAGTNVSWSNHRYMNPYEFACHLRTAYTEITADQLEYGDVIRLYSDWGDEVHGFIYLGLDTRDESKQIVFTKNGYAQGYYLVQDFNTVANYIYPGNRVSYHRVMRAAVDPSDRSSSACYDEYGMSGVADESRDGILEAGLRKARPESLPVLAL